MKVLILGLNPSPLMGKSPTLKNLYNWLDILELKRVSFSNIYSGFGEFSTKQVERNHLNEICPQYDKIIALGSKVGNVLDNLGFSHFTLPHPSPKNRLLNNRTAVEQKLQLCKLYLEL